MNQHILIVDDEAPIREMLKLALAKCGYRVTDVSSALEAEVVVRDDPPQLIVSDLQLEESDGLAMVAKLKAAIPNAPILLLTGVFFDPQVVRDTLGTHIDSYLHKSASLSAIVDEITRLLSRSQ